MKRSNKKYFISNQKGLALLSALIVMAILTALGMSGIYLSSTDIKIAKNYRLQKQKFYAAEAAIARGTGILNLTSISNWTNLLSGATESDPEVILADLEDVQFHSMTYTLMVRNNLDDPVFKDGNYTTDEKYSTDTDDILVLIAEGNGDSGMPKYVETAIKWTPQTERSYGGKDITTDNINVTTASITWQ